MRIYDGEFTVGQILEDCRLNRRDSEQPLVRNTDGVDLEKLSRRIDNIPVDEIRRRRARLNVFYEEVLVSADPDFGISFTSCLMILAHYNVINDSKSLKYVLPWCRFMLELCANYLIADLRNSFAGEPAYSESKKRFDGTSSLASSIPYTGLANSAEG